METKKMKSLQETKEGHCTQITVEVLPDNYVKISDNGRGIPLVPNDKRNQDVLEKIFGGHPITDLEYGQMGDLAQDGLQTVCSLSESFCIIVYRDGSHF